MSADSAASIRIALLRAVNVGGRAMVAMADLRAMLVDLGFAGARTLLQSGNLVFRSTAGGAKLEALLQAELAKRFGLRTDVFVRTAAEWTEIVAANPFPEAAERDPGHLLVMPCKEAPSAAAVRALQASIAGSERVRAVGKQAYLVYPDGIGRSKLTMAKVERGLGTHGTGRNWNTVLKLGALTKG